MIKFKEFINEKIKLNDVSKVYKGMHYILKSDAEQMVKDYGKDAYEISDDGKGFYKITKDEGGRVGDFLLSIPTEKDLKDLPEGK